jgi:hypothetical protein
MIRNRPPRVFGAKPSGGFIDTMVLVLVEGPVESFVGWLYFGAKSYDKACLRVARRDAAAGCGDTAVSLSVRGDLGNA